MGGAYKNEWAGLRYLISGREVDFGLVGRSKVHWLGLHVLETLDDYYYTEIVGPEMTILESGWPGLRS